MNERRVSVKEYQEEIFVDKVLRIVDGELRQLERMLESMNGDEVQIAHLRGERSRLLQMKGIFEEHKQELNSNT